ncbi:DNA primase large subunit [Gryllus bimaculatus]|nr:DNA primase large subunit [Gryllus bimaculatus]
MSVSRDKRKGLPKISIVNDRCRATAELSRDLQLYTIPPSFIVPLAEVYRSVTERLEVLRILQHTLPKVLAKNVEDQKSAVLQQLQKQGLITYAKLLVSCGHGETGVVIKERTADYVSHFFLRLIYSQSENWRHWFLNRELELFRLRFHSLNAEGVTNFLEEYGLWFTPISDEEKKSMMHNLLTSTANMSQADVATTTFFKVPYIDVLDLISDRKVYMSGGYAFIPFKDITSVFCTLFKNHLCRALEELSVSDVEEVKSDERFQPLIGHAEWFLHKTNNSGETVVAEEDLDALSQESFPPCMRQLHESIRKTHHAKHGARLQYGLFLKGIGLPLEESIKFWKTELTKIMTREKKEYLYSIRHSYGQEGRRVSYTPYSCAKILSETIGIGDCHGCPFKHNSAQILKNRFESYGIPPSGLQIIMNLVFEGQYQLACSKYFEIIHSSTLEKVICDPNEFFKQSQKIRCNYEEKLKENYGRNGNIKFVKTDKALVAVTISESHKSKDDNSK